MDDDYEDHTDGYGNEPEDDEMDHDMNDEEQEDGVRISLLLSSLDVCTELRTATASNKGGAP